MSIEIGQHLADLIEKVGTLLFIGFFAWLVFREPSSNNKGK